MLWFWIYPVVIQGWHSKIYKVYTCMWEIYKIQPYFHQHVNERLLLRALSFDWIPSSLKFIRLSLKWPKTERSIIRSERRQIEGITMLKQRFIQSFVLFGVWVYEIHSVKKFSFETAPVWVDKIYSLITLKMVEININNISFLIRKFREIFN